MQTPIIPDRFLLTARIVLVVFTLVGIGGMCFFPEEFRSLSPVHLLLNFAAFVLFAPVLDGQTMRYFILCFAAGFAVELIGVDTGRVFGAYHYGDALGFKIKGVPLLIGINWLLLAFTALTLTEKIKASVYVRALIGAALMTGLDVLIEQLCSTLDFWYWDIGHAPIRNYIAWFVFSFFLQMVGQSMAIERRHPLGGLIYALQVLFFLALLLAQFVMTAGK